MVLGTSPERFATFRRALHDARGSALAIPLSGYPDPDAMASGWALAEIAAAEGVDATVLHAHPVSHAENRLMVQVLGVPLARYDRGADPRRFGRFSLVDTHELSPSYSALARLPCLSVWDHHEGEVRARAEHSDVRAEAGATSTIATEYLEAAGLLDRSRSLSVGDRFPATGGSALARLATALLVGIASDTEDFLLAHPADFAASARLVELANRPLFRRIHRRAYTVAAMSTLERALTGIVHRGTLGVAWIGMVEQEERDTIPQAADLLVSRADLDTVLVYGQVGQAIDGSLRTINPGVLPERMILAALGTDASGRPFGGGREGKGGFQLPLRTGSPEEVARLRDRVESGFLREADRIPRMV